MNLHQIVSGACNAGDKCFAVGSVEGVPFTVCICHIYICAISRMYAFRRMQQDVISLFLLQHLKEYRSFQGQYMIIFE